ncbi:MAG: winged helix-turn-helix transcriptional regulator [Gemmatimonadaceae bacterium]|nr:winged helix-turn-helix transcriptional regulator [Gemmatimonadaceae bacterium]
MQPSSYGIQPSPGLDATLAALADPTRRAILARLASGAVSVTELARPFDMSQPAISKHIKVLERAGLVSRGRDAQRRPVRLNAEPMAEVAAYLERYRRHWERTFATLDTLLESMQNPAPPSPAPTPNPRKR